MPGEVSRQAILDKLGEMFQDDSYEYLAIFLIAHGHCAKNDYGDMYHFL